MVPKSSNYNVEEFFNVALKLTKSCGQLIKDRFMSSSKQVATKSGKIDFVTETDQEIEQLLIEGLSAEFPDHKFIGEEGVASGSKCHLTEAPTWVIDPLDGTMNFIHSFPHVCVSVALLVNKSPQIGIVYNPIEELLYTAKKGQGAYLNGKKIRVSKAQQLENALIMIEFGSNRDSSKMDILFENQERLMAKAHGLRGLGSAALNMGLVACGAADAHYEMGIHIWDFAAAELLITEAGGVVIDPAGGKLDRHSRRILCASSLKLGRQMAKELIQFYPERD